MNNTNNTNKSDYRIADLSNSLHTSQHSSSVPQNDNIQNNDRLTKIMDTQNNTNTTNNNNSINTNTINTNINSHTHSSPTAHRFSNLNSSPSLEDITNTVSIASINVRGINNSTKFESILEDLTTRSLSIIGLQETKLNETGAIAHFKEFSARNTAAKGYRAYWDFNTQDRAAGVSLVIASYISKYVQRVHRKSGRFIAIDIYLPGKKLKIINVYAHQAGDYPTKGKLLTKYVIDHIKQAETEKIQKILFFFFKNYISI